MMNLKIFVWIFIVSFIAANVLNLIQIFFMESSIVVKNIYIILLIIGLISGITAISIKSWKQHQKDKKQ